MRLPNAKLVTVLALSAMLLGSIATASEQRRGRRGDRPRAGSPYQLETKRSPAIGHRGVVATSQPLASLAGLDILKKGGNAIDAAIATAAVLTVVEPQSTSLGGDMFAMVYLAEEDTLVGLNGSGRAAYGMTPEALKNRLDDPQLDRIPGIYSVTVPGAVDGWFTLHERYGSLSMAEILEPAIYYAEHGFHVTEIISVAWAGSARRLAGEPSANETWLVDGEAPKVGDRFVNPALARTLEALATEGRDAFYKGPIAESIVAYSDSKDGFLTMKDFEDHTSTWVEPISTDYKNYTLYELPPNGQGIAALEMINTLENVDMKGFGHNSPEYLHHFIEAKKLAYADLRQWVGDPAANPLPVAELISKDYGERQFGRIDADRAQEQVESGLPPHGDTVLLQVMDKDHNAVSFIYSIFASFGSGLVVPDTGITLQTAARCSRSKRATSMCWRPTSGRSTPSSRRWPSRTASFS